MIKLLPIILLAGCATNACPPLPNLPEGYAARSQWIDNVVTLYATCAESK